MTKKPLTNFVNVEKIALLRSTRLREAEAHVATLQNVIVQMRSWMPDQHIDNQKLWGVARLELTTLNQCIHEANALNNAMVEK